MTCQCRSFIAITQIFLLAACANQQPRLLPICNLQCVSGEQCTKEHSVSTKDIETLTEKLSGSFLAHRVDVISVTSGYAIVLTNDETDQKIRESWGAVGCFTATTPPSRVDYARLEQCISGMTKWINFRNPSEARDLMLDSSFRQTCMNSTER